MNINENKEIANAEPEYILLNTYFHSIAKKYTVSTLELEYDANYSIFARTVTDRHDNPDERYSKNDYWLGFRDNDRHLFYIAGAETILDAFDTVERDEVWFKDQTSLLHVKNPDDESANPDN
mgnify:CR=1 FL=1